MEARGRDVKKNKIPSAGNYSSTSTAGLDSSFSKKMPRDPAQKTIILDCVNDGHFSIIRLTKGRRFLASRPICFFPGTANTPFSTTWRREKEVEMNSVLLLCRPSEWSYVGVQWIETVSGGTTQVEGHCGSSGVIYHVITPFECSSKLPNKFSIWKRFFIIYVCVK